MAYSNYLVDRVRERLQKANVTEEKKMMGGYIFMVNHKMCVGKDVHDDLIFKKKEEFELAYNCIEFDKKVDFFA